VKGLNVLVLAVCGLLAGCAGTAGTGGESNVSKQGPDTESQQRARAFTVLAAAYQERGQYKIALDELRKAITADSRYGPAYNIYGLVYMELGEDRLADENFRRAIELDRTDSVAHNNYGWFLCTRGQYDAGLAEFEAALRNPLYVTPERAMSNAGMCAERKGDLALAEASLNKALKLQPNSADTVLKLAGLQFRQGRLVEAQRGLARHAELSQPTAESLWLGVRIERRLGDRQQEAAYGLQLRKRFPDSKEARQLLAGQYE